MLAIPEPLNQQIVMDLAAHEHDLRLALGQPGAQDEEAVTIGGTFILRGLRAGDPDLVAQIEALDLSAFEVFRAITGRRSAAQLVALGIPVEPLAVLMERSPMSITPDDVHEDVAH